MCMYVYVCVCMCMYVYVCVCMCMYVYVCMICCDGGKREETGITCSMLIILMLIHFASVNRSSTFLLHVQVPFLHDIVTAVCVDAFACFLHSIWAALYRQLAVVTPTSL